jgi:predicted enzyme related to lactoylglutathione lyase
MRGLCHVDLNVPDSDRALGFYDRMFGWLGYRSFSTLGIELRRHLLNCPSAQLYRHAAQRQC